MSDDKIEGHFLRKRLTFYGFLVKTVLLKQFFGNFFILHDSSFCQYYYVKGSGSEVKLEEYYIEKYHFCDSYLY